jgi:hypothetical protein
MGTFWLRLKTLTVATKCGYCMGIHNFPFAWPDRFCGQVATDPKVRVRFSALPDFLRSSRSGTGSTQPRECNLGATWKKKSSSSGLESREYGLRDPSRWPFGTLYPQKLALTSPTSGSRSVGVVRSRTQATESFFKTYPRQWKIVGAVIFYAVCLVWMNSIRLVLSRTSCW